jgi:tetratricopeptide (TPR) repeat protein
LDWALWQNWRGAGFAAARVRPDALTAASRSRSIAHDLARPGFILAQRVRRDGWRGLLPTRSGLPAGLAQADRARDRGQWQRAAIYYRKALAEEPEAAAIWVQYGHALKEMGDIAAAEAAYREALRHDADAADIWLQLGHALKLQGRIGEAEAAYQQALSLDPGLDNAARELLAVVRDRQAADAVPFSGRAVLNGNCGSE